MSEIGMLDWLLGEGLPVLYIIFFISLFFLYGLIVYCKIFFGRNRKIRIEKYVSKRSPNLSATLSFMFPGFGQIYNGEIYRGSIYIVLTLFIFSIGLFTSLLLGGKDPITLLSVSLPFVLAFLFVYINGVIDAYRTALIINKKVDLAKRENINRIVNLIKWGLTLYSNKNYKTAIGIYTEIISLNPNYRLAYYIRGLIHYKLDNHLKAGNDFISAAKLGHKKAQRILKSKYKVEMSTDLL